MTPEMPMDHQVARATDTSGFFSFSQEGSVVRKPQLNTTVGMTCPMPDQFTAGMRAASMPDTPNWTTHARMHSRRRMKPPYCTQMLSSRLR